METASERQVQDSFWRRLIIGRRPRWTLVRLAVVVAASLFLFTGVLIPIRVRGTSMVPSYRDGAINLVNTWSYSRHGPRRGDVVAIRYPDSALVLLKRVVGLPGERIAIRRGTVFINGAALDESYVKNPRALWHLPEMQLGPTQCFALGDNREMNQWDHVYGPFELRQIVGKVVF